MITINLSTEKRYVHQRGLQSSSFIPFRKILKEPSVDFFFLKPKNLRRIVTLTRMFPICIQVYHVTGFFWIFRCTIRRCVLLQLRALQPSRFLFPWTQLTATTGKHNLPERSAFLRAPFIPIQQASEHFDRHQSS